jgi:sugar lactone lactonase YvrE
MDDSVFLVEPSGNVTRIAKAQAGPIGSIAVSSTDELYYTDRHREAGALLKWQDGKIETVVSSLPFAQNMTFGLDGTLYLTQMLQAHILKIDASTGGVSTFVEDACGNEPCYLAVDKEGDIWARGFQSLRQFSPDGVEKAFVVDGQTYLAGPYTWHTSAGIAFDDEGAL